MWKYDRITDLMDALLFNAYIIHAVQILVMSESVRPLFHYLFVTITREVVLLGVLRRWEWISQWMIGFFAIV